MALGNFLKDTFHIGGKKKDNKTSSKKQNKDDSASKKEALTQIQALTQRAQNTKLTREQYNQIVKEKALWESQAGNEADAKSAKAELDNALETANSSITEQENTKRKNDKTEKYVNAIDKQRNTPLETLIAKNATLPGDINPADDEGKYDVGNGEITRKEVAKEKIASSPHNAKEAVKDYFLNFKSHITGTIGKLTSVTDAAGTGNDIVGDSIDLSDIDKVAKDIHEEEGAGEAGGVIGAVLGGFGAFLKLINHGIGIYKEFKKNHDAGDSVNRDNQERFKLIRKYLREGVDILEGFIGIGGAWGSEIPLYGSITGLIFGGTNFIFDLIDMIATSVHVEFMRRERNAIFKRIQAKRDKYSATDKEAAEAYDIGEIGFFSTEAKTVDKKRRSLMESLGKEAVTKGTPGTTGKMTKATKLRSRNDSAYRNLQYGLGNRISAIETVGTDGKVNKENKSKKRQLEALEMMEQYREADKSHKKMRKALYHTLEDIGTGSAGIIGNGLKLAGELAILSVAGAPGGVALVKAGKAVGLALGAYDTTRDAVSKVYNGARKLTGTQDNKDTTRTDMAISLMDRMTEISSSQNVWSGSKFKSKTELQNLKAGNGRKDLIRQGRNVEHLHAILRRGLDVTMSDLIASKSRSELKERIAESFGQE